MRRQLRHVQPSFAVPDTLHPSALESSRQAFWETKNHPKLRMAKIYVATDICDNLQYVTEMLAADGPDNLAPTGICCSAGFMAGEGYVVAPGNDYMPWEKEVTSRYSNMFSPAAHIVFQILPLQMSWLKQVVIFQPGSIEANDTTFDTCFMPDFLNDAGFDVILEHGSKDWETGEVNWAETYPAVESDELPLVQGSKSLGLGDLFLSR
jgi:hypothetical protein